MRLLTYSEDDSKENNKRENVKIDIDGTVSKQIGRRSYPGRHPLIHTFISFS